MMPDDRPDTSSRGRRIWKTVREELDEIVWLTSVIGLLSAAGVGLAVALAAA